MSKTLLKLEETSINAIDVNLRHWTYPCYNDKALIETVIKEYD